MVTVSVKTAGVGEGWNGREKGEESSQEKSPRSITPQGTLFVCILVILHPGSMARTYHTGGYLLNSSWMRVHFPFRGARRSAGIRLMMAMAATIPMIATTIKSSTRVKPSYHSIPCPYLE